MPAAPAGGLDPRREQRRRDMQPAEQGLDPGRRPRRGAGTPDPVQHHAGVLATLWIEFLERITTPGIEGKLRRRCDAVEGVGVPSPHPSPMGRGNPQRSGRRVRGNKSPREDGFAVETWRLNPGIGRTCAPHR